MQSNEDYELLHDLEQSGARIRFSPGCCYLVRDACAAQSRRVSAI